MATFFCPKGHPTITTRFTRAELAEEGIVLVDDASQAQVLVAALLEELVPEKVPGLVR